MSHDQPPLSPREVAARYRIRVETEPARPVAGQETRVSVIIADASGRPVTTLQVHHERLAHFLVVSENLEEFHHLHAEDFGLLTAEAKTRGWFTFPVTFGSGGRYGLAADFMDRDREVHWSATLEVDGPAQGPTVWRLSRDRKADGLEARLITDPNPPVARKETEGILEIKSGGRLVGDLDLWLGALCHLAILGERLSSSAHEHGGDEAMARGGMPRPNPDYRGPRIYFGYEFPAPGRYRIFSQFERAGRVYTVPFDVEVGPSPAGRRPRPASLRARAPS
jgi:hypothetical protein